MKERLEQVRRRVALAAAQTGRSDDVTLVAVSKRQPVEAVRAAHGLGCRDFGENYGQELLDKAARCEDLEGIRWHHIGHLQRNKVKMLIGRVALLQGVDSRKLLDVIERRSAEAGERTAVLLQVHLGDEATKSGCEPADLGALVEHARTLNHVALRGLMAVPPAVDQPMQARAYFRQLRELRDAHGGRERLPELSMGMSHDFEVAIEEGATMVRVGTAIFGARPL
jgi:hypothetical protein